MSSNNPLAMLINAIKLKSCLSMIELKYFDIKFWICNGFADIIVVPVCFSVSAVAVLIASAILSYVESEGCVVVQPEREHKH